MSLVSSSFVQHGMDVISVIGGVFNCEKFKRVIIINSNESLTKKGIFLKRSLNLEGINIANKTVGVVNGIGRGVLF